MYKKKFVQKKINGRWVSVNVNDKPKMIFKPPSVKDVSKVVSDNLQKEPAVEKQPVKINTQKGTDLSVDKILNVNGHPEVKNRELGVEELRKKRMRIINKINRSLVGNRSTEQSGGRIAFL
jgi:hypothetical protein